MTKPIDNTAVASDKDVALTWSIVVKQDKEISLSYHLRSLIKTDIYVLNRLWTLGSGGHVEDQKKVYIFERDGDLRFLLGVAPLPRKKSVLYRNVPFATLLPAGGEVDGHITLSLPVVEYSPYFPSPGGGPTQHVDRAHFLVHYVLADPEITAKARKDMPGALDLQPTAMGHLKVVVAKAPLTGVEVLRSTGDFSRVNLPGETPEPYVR